MWFVVRMWIKCFELGHGRGRRRCPRALSIIVLLLGLLSNKKLGNAYCVLATRVLCIQAQAKTLHSPLIVVVVVRRLRQRSFS